MALAQDELKKAKDLVKKLTDSKTVKMFSGSTPAPHSQVLTCSPLIFTLQIYVDHFLCNRVRYVDLSQMNSCPFPLQEYEQLAAQLDGAKADLSKKVKEISEAAAKENIVRAAEDHAEELLKMAKELEKQV